MTARVMSRRHQCRGSSASGMVSLACEAGTVETVLLTHPWAARVVSLVLHPNDHYEMCVLQVPRHSRVKPLLGAVGHVGQSSRPQQRSSSTVWVQPMVTQQPSTPPASLI